MCLSATVFTPSTNQPLVIYHLDSGHHHNEILDLKQIIVTKVQVITVCKVDLLYKVSHEQPAG